MTSLRLKTVALSLVAGLWVLPAGNAWAQQTPSSQQAAPITFETTAADISRRFPAGGASFAAALRGFLDANAGQLGPALDHIATLLPGLNSAQSEMVGEVLGRLATDLMARKDLDNLLLVQQLIARGNSFVIAGYNRSTGLNLDTAGLGGGAGVGGGAGPTGSIGATGGSNGGSGSAGNVAYGTSSSNPITGGGGSGASLSRTNYSNTYTYSISPF
ncbi:MAG: hypothetical protein HC900_01220 [Methylacidiphilales bacterium]|nr:hypothetical protein [Candidatus Methylacidiphilales bacterium]